MFVYLAAAARLHVDHFFRNRDGADIPLQINAPTTRLFHAAHKFLRSQSHRFGYLLERHMTEVVSRPQG